MFFIANSCQIKGLSTFIVNLFRTGLRVVTPLKGHWMFQYMHGLCQEVFPIILPATFHEEGLTFEQVSHFSKFKYPRQNLNFLSKFSALKLVWGKKP
jgi:potassium large conductance calcium-activated channel subfamily M alpha protein 1